MTRGRFTRESRRERLTPEAVADISGHPLELVHRAIERRELKAVDVDGQLLISRHALRRWHKAWSVRVGRMVRVFQDADAAMPSG